MVYEGEHIVLATGSEPRSLPGLDLDGDRVISSDDALRYARVPELGDHPGRRRHRGRVRERMALLRGRGHDRGDAAASAAAGGRVEREAAAARVPPPGHRLRAGGAVRKREGNRDRRDRDPGGGKTLDADLLLVAVGRGPVSAGLGYEEAGVEMERGLRQGRRVLPDERADHLRRRGPDRHAAARPRRIRRGHHGRRAGGGLDVTPIDYDGVPRITYSDPEVASVGITSAAAVERGIEITELSYPLGGNGKSVILQTQGAAKVIAARRRTAPG